MTMETKQLHNLSRIYREKVAKTEVDEGLMDTLKGVGSFIKNPKATIQKKVDSALTGATKKGKLGPIKVGGSASKLGSVGAPNAGSYSEEKKAAKDYDGDGKVESGKDEYFGSKDKAIKKAMGKKVKESYSDWRYDLKEVPNYSQIPISSTKRNEKITEKNVKNNIKINPDMKEGYEETKTKEVMGALKKRELKKDVKKKIAADIVKKKGDTSKSDDRYAYENYQAMRNPEKEEKKDKRSAKQKRMDSPDRGINSPAFKEFMRQQGM